MRTLLLDTSLQTPRGRYVNIFRMFAILIGGALIALASTSPFAQVNPNGTQCEKCIAAGESIYPGRDQWEYCRRITMCPPAGGPAVQAPAMQGPVAQNPAPAQVNPNGAQCDKCIAAGESVYPGTDQREYCRRIAMCPPAGGPAVQAPAMQAPVAQNPAPAGQPPALQPAAAGDLAVGDCVAVDNVAVRGQPGRIIALTAGGYVVQNEGKAASEAMNWVRADVRRGPCPSAAADQALANQPHSCFASDADAAGGAGLQQNIRAVIRRTYEHGPAAGADGAVTISFQSVNIGAARRWARSDGYNFSADQSKPIYDARVAFTTCTDYKASIMKVVQQRAFQCFTAPTGDFSCQTSAAVAGAPDQKTNIPKF